MSTLPLPLGLRGGGRSGGGISLKAYHSQSSRRKRWVVVFLLVFCPLLFLLHTARLEVRADSEDLLRSGSLGTGAGGSVDMADGTGGAVGAGTGVGGSDRMAVVGMGSDERRRVIDAELQELDALLNFDDAKVKRMQNGPPSRGKHAQQQHLQEQPAAAAADVADTLPAAQAEQWTAETADSFTLQEEQRAAQAVAQAEQMAEQLHREQQQNNKKEQKRRKRKPRSSTKKAAALAYQENAGRQEPAARQVEEEDDDWFQSQAEGGRAADSGLEVEPREMAEETEQLEEEKEEDDEEEEDEQEVEEEMVAAARRMDVAADTDDRFMGSAPRDQAKDVDELIEAVRDEELAAKLALKRKQSKSVGKGKRKSARHFNKMPAQKADEEDDAREAARLDAIMNRLQALEKVAGDQPDGQRDYQQRDYQQQQNSQNNYQYQDQYDQQQQQQYQSQPPHVRRTGPKTLPPAALRPSRKSAGPNNHYQQSNDYRNQQQQQQRQQPHERYDPADSFNDPNGGHGLPQRPNGRDVLRNAAAAAKARANSVSQSAAMLASEQARVQARRRVAMSAALGPNNAAAAAPAASGPVDDGEVAPPDLFAALSDSIKRGAKPMRSRRRQP